LLSTVSEYELHASSTFAVNWIQLFLAEINIIICKLHQLLNLLLPPEEYLQITFKNGLVAYFYVKMHIELYLGVHSFIIAIGNYFTCASNLATKYSNL